MSPQFCFLWNNDEKKMIRLAIDQATKFPFEIKHENGNYYACVGLPGYYIHPANEESLLNMFVCYLQTMGKPKRSHLSCVDVYEADYNALAPLPESLGLYLYSLGCTKLVNDVVGIHPDFSYNLFLHHQLGTFSNDMKLNQGSVLEMGCGEGKHLLFLKDKFPSMSVYGIDATSSGIASGKRAAAHWGLDVNFYSMKGEQSQFPDNNFDMVYCHAVMMYRDINCHEIFQNMYRMSKRWILLIDCFPELWAPGTPRTMAALNYFQLLNYNFGFYNSLLRNDLKLKYKIHVAQRLKHSWNPLCEPSLVIIEKMG